MTGDGEADTSIRETIKPLLERRFVVTRGSSLVNIGAVPLTARPYMVLREKNTVDGFAGCNRFFGGCRIEDDKNSIELGPLATTRMYCEGMMEMERGFLSALQAGRRIKASKNGFSLLGGDGSVVLEFEEAP